MKVIYGVKVGKLNTVYLSDKKGEHAKVHDIPVEYKWKTTLRFTCKELETSAAFVSKIFEHLHHLIPTPKQSEWRNFINGMLDEGTYSHEPNDATYLRKYVSQGEAEAHAELAGRGDV